MEIINENLKLETKGNKVTYIDITDDINKKILNSGVDHGLCVVISPHTTCSVIYEEFSHDIDENGDEFLQADLNNVLKKIIPDHIDGSVYNYPGEAHYKAVESWPNAKDYLPNGDRTALFNGDAHLKSTLLGSSQSFAIKDKKLDVGSTGYIYFVDFDKTRERNRKCQVVIIGE